MPAQRHSSKEYTENYYEQQLKKQDDKKNKKGGQRPIRNTVLPASQETFQAITKSV